MPENPAKTAICKVTGYVPLHRFSSRAAVRVPSRCLVMQACIERVKPQQQSETPSSPRKVPRPRRRGLPSDLLPARDQIRTQCPNTGWKCPDSSRIEQTHCFGDSLFWHMPVGWHGSDIRVEQFSGGDCYVTSAGMISSDAVIRQEPRTILRIINHVQP